MASANIVKKLSMKHLVGGNVAKFIPMKEIEEKRGDKTVVKEVPAVGETTWIAQVVGIARQIKSGESNYGYWEALLGDFVAVPLVGEKAGQRFRTAQLFLPDVVHQMVAASVNGNLGVEFAFKIGITAAPTDGERPSATGYEYTADFVIEAKENDPLEQLVKAGLPALPAPEKEKALPKS